MHVLFKLILLKVYKIIYSLSLIDKSMLASCDMIKEYHLSVFLGWYLNSLSTIARGILIRINIYDFPVSLVSEEQSCI